MWFIVMVICCAAAMFWKFTVAIIVVYLIVKASQHIHARHTARRTAEAKRAAEAKRVQGLLDRATKQHKQVQKGNIGGVYGAYPVPKECKGIGIWLAD